MDLEQLISFLRIIKLIDKNFPIISLSRASSQDIFLFVTGMTLIPIIILPSVCSNRYVKIKTKILESILLRL